MTNEQLIVTIDAALPRTKDEDTRVLTYIRDSVTEEAIARREEGDRSVTHLHEVAKQRLAKYIKEDDPA